jgi:SAM-dependent methyltransferase
LPPGVLAQSRGKNGWIRVEERDNLRLLTIDGAVQGALDPNDLNPSNASSVAAEPVAGLIRAFRPQAASALVIGLGTGRTATALAESRISPTVVELEPAVVDYARKFFGYTGSAVVDDGLHYALNTDQVYDLVLLDANLGSALPEHLVTDEALRAYRSRLAPDGVLVVRTTGTPQSPQVASVFRRMPHHVKLMFGTGVGTEPQNLTLLSSPSDLFAADLSRVAAWPVVVPGSPSEPIPSHEVTHGVSRGASREVAVLGYLLRTGDGTLCLDLPHWEMGAVRYVLVGPEAQALGKKLPAHSTFPTSGDISSDGDPSPTLHGLLGGGGVKRSDVRFSPVAASLRGTARVRAVTHPDGRGPGPVHPLIPYGGVLYELEVTDVVWTYDRASWTRLRRSTLEPLARKAETSFRSGDLMAGHRAVAAYTDALSKAVPAEFRSKKEMERFSDALRSELDRAPHGDFAIGSACDRVAHRDLMLEANADVPPLLRALRACAANRYRRVGTDQGAARLLYLLEGEPDLIPGAEKVLGDLRKRFPGLVPATEPGR